MSIMTNPVGGCANLSEATFTRPVWVALLVGGGDDDAPEGAIFRDGELTPASERVIDHLIHGKPLHPCQFPEEIGASLEENGICLRRYQKEGIAWIQFLRSVRLNGAFCDDMVLGKTLQALIGICMAYHKYSLEDPNARPKSLIVCPSLIVGHWSNEVQKVLPDNLCGKDFQYTGPLKQRKRL